MPGKPDPTAIKEITLRTVGGEAAGASALAPKVGPLGLSAKKIGEDIQKATMMYKGLRITVKLIVQNREAKIVVLPSASSCIIKELNEPERDRKKTKHIAHTGNLSKDQLFKITREMRPQSLAKKFSGTAKEILGTCASIGCTVEKQDPRDIQEQIDDGSFICPDE